MAEYVKHTGGSVAGKSRKPYDAMVYKDADSGYTIAIDGNGNVIKKVLSSLNTDEVAIQAAINGYNHVILKSGSYSIGTSISGVADKVLEGEGKYQSVISLVSNVIGFNIGVSSFKLKSIGILANSSQTNPVIQFTGGLSTISRNRIEDISISSSASAPTSFSAIKFNNTGTAGIWDTICNNIYIYNCENVLELYSEGSTPWINLNSFINFTVNGFVRGIYVHSSGLTSSNYGSNGNTFINWLGQCSSHTTYGVKVENDLVTPNAAGGRNLEFYSVHFIDMPAGGKYIDFDSAVDECMIFGGTLEYSLAKVNDNSRGTSVIERKRTNLKKLYNGNIVVVKSDGSGDYSTLSAALGAISPSDSNRYAILIIGKISESDTVSAKSYVDVIGLNAKISITKNSAGAGVDFNGISNSTWRDITIERLGSPGTATSTGRVKLSADNLIFENVKFINSSTGALKQYGMAFESTSTPVSVTTFINCEFIGGGTSQGYGINCAANAHFVGCKMVGGNGGIDSHGAWVTTSNSGGMTDVKLINCTILGGSGGSRCYGLFTADGSCVELIGCDIQGGDGGVECHGVVITQAGSPIISGGRISPGISSSSYGIFCMLNSSPKISNLEVVPKFYSGSQAFTGANTTVTPFSTYPYFIESIQVYVSVAASGGTPNLHIGSTYGGDEICSIDISSVGDKSNAINRVGISASSSFYIVPDDLNARFTIKYCVGYNSSYSYAAYIHTGGDLRISNCKLLSNQASSAVYVSAQAIAAAKYRLENCSLEKVETNMSTFDIEQQSSGVAYLYNCTLRTGTYSNVSAFPGRGTNSTITVGNTYVDVPHSLPNTPTTVRITPTTNLGTRSFWVDNKGATTFRININSSDVIDHTFDWEAEV